MNRSKRKTPIFGIATSKSEKNDKHIWHARLLARTRTSLAVASTGRLDGYFAPTANEVGSVWSMAKDGKKYFQASDQLAIATRLARKGKTSLERQSLTIRMLKKWGAK